MVNVEKLSENRVKLTIEVTSEEFDKALDKAFEKVVKEVKVDGFRPGKLPKSVFLQRFGYEPLYQDALNFALEESYPNALAEAKVYPTSEPKIDLDKEEEIKQGSGFKYTAEVDCWPEVHLGEYKGLNVKKRAVRITKKEVDEAVDQALKQKGENILKDGEAANGDTVVLDFEGFVDGVAFEGGKAEKYSLTLGSNSFVPGFEDALIGVKAGEARDVEVTFPADYHENLAGKKAVFKCLVHEVKAKVYPELNDEFVADLELEGVKTVDEYLAHVKEDLKNKAKEEVEKEFEEACIKMVVDASYAEFPESLLASSVERSLNRAQEQAKQYQIPLDVFLNYAGLGTVEEFKESQRKAISRQYLEELCFEKIMELEGIQASADEIEAEYLKAAGGDAKRVKDLKKQYSVSQIAYSIAYRKVIDFIKDNVAK